MGMFCALTVLGSDEAADKVMSYVKNDKGEVDFNVLFPIPEEFRISAPLTVLSSDLPVDEVIGDVSYPDNPGKISLEDALNKVLKGHRVISTFIAVIQDRSLDRSKTVKQSVLEVINKLQNPDSHGASVDNSRLLLALLQLCYSLKRDYLSTTYGAGVAEQWCLDHWGVEENAQATQSDESNKSVSFHLDDCQAPVEWFVELAAKVRTFNQQTEQRTMLIMDIFLTDDDRKLLPENKSIVKFDGKEITLTRTLGVL